MMFDVKRYAFLLGGCVVSEYQIGFSVELHSSQELNWDHKRYSLLWIKILLPTKKLFHASHTYISQRKETFIIFFQSENKLAAQAANFVRTLEPINNCSSCCCVGLVIKRFLCISTTHINTIMWSNLDPQLYKKRFVSMKMPCENIVHMLTRNSELSSVTLPPNLVH